MCISQFWSVFGPVTNPKSLCFTAEMLCFGPTQGPPKGGPGAPPGGRFETQKSCKSIVFAVYLAMVNPKSRSNLTFLINCASGPSPGALFIKKHWFYMCFWWTRRQNHYNNNVWGTKGGAKGARPGSARLSGGLRGASGGHQT